MAHRKKTTKAHRKPTLCPLKNINIFLLKFGLSKHQNKVQKKVFEKIAKLHVASFK